MRNKFVMLCGLAAMVLTLQPAAAETTIALDSPLEWQVFQRNAEECANLKVAGAIPADATVVEAMAELGAGLHGKAIDWTVVAKGAQIKDGKFSGSLKLAAGGWYTLKVRFRKSADDPAVLGEAAVEHVGVGDIFVVAGQSNSSNHGAEKQTTKTGLVVAFDGNRWQPANDPQPGASGDAGSFMPPFGDAIATKFNVPVGIIACGIGATSVREWLPKGTTFPNPPTLEGRVRQLPSGEWESKGEAFEMLVNRMKQLGPRGFRAVLWHQGESDAGQADPKRTLIGKPYRQYIEQLIRASRKEIGWDAPWFVALVSSHGGDGVPELRAAQKSLWDDGIALEGPDSDALKGDLRDGVHFSGKGLREHGARWAEKVAPRLEKQKGDSTSDKASAETRIVLDDADSGRVFEGIGAVSAGGSSRNFFDYPEKQKSEILDYLFTPKFGANLQHLKVGLSGGENDTDGSEPTHALTREELADPKPRGSEFWLMAEARKRNSKILLDCLAWSYPGWISSPFSQDSADWYVAFLDVARKHYGLKMDWLAAGWNEKGTDLNWIAKTLRPTLDAHGYADVKLQAPDNNGSWQILDDLARNPEADKVIQAVGYHYPNEFGPQIEAEANHAAEKVIATGKPLWSSEEFCYSGKTWEMAMLLAQVYNKNYIRSRITKTEVWPMLSGMYPGLAFYGAGLMLADTPWSGCYDIYPAVWTTAHTTQFTESGWRYMDKACAKIATNTWAGSYVALRNPANGDWSLIVCADKPVAFQVQVAGKLARGDVHVWKSNEKIQFIEEKPLRLTNSAFTISLEGNSVYTLSTTTGQKKGAYPAPPPAADFPLPYKDDFESYDAGAIAKYTTDMKGSFETAKRKDGKGICLKQIAPKEGILWGGAGGDLPHTHFGDHNWTDYTIQADVLVTAGKAGIGGRYWCGEQRGAGLVLQQDGTWSIEASVEAVEVVNGMEKKLQVPPLATGKIDGFIPATWHHLTLVLKGDELTTSIDGKEVARVRYEKFYPAHKSGRAYLMSSYDPNCFDNVSVSQ